MSADERASDSAPDEATRKAPPKRAHASTAGYPLKLRVYVAIRRWLRSPGVQGAIAGMIAGYLRLVRRTSRLVYEPADPHQIFDPNGKALIVTMWHGQHFMLPYARRKDTVIKVLISRHGDGEINARVAEKFGVGTIRGSTARDPSRMFEKGGAVGFLAMKAALEEGTSVAMTADISNVKSRRAGLGVVSLAKVSGHPILPVAFATSRRIDVKSWDRATINLPFSRAACVYGELIHVPDDADAAKLEEMRLAVEEGLNAATDRAYAIADRRHG